MTTTVRLARRTPAERPRIKRILSLLAREYPSPRCALKHRNPLELLVATVLSAQCTDVRVNQVTTELFGKYRTVADYAHASLPQLEADIRSTGFYRNKARAIQGFAREILRRHDGEVPRTLDELVALPGVGRKTANLVLAEAFGIPGMVVDTHVGRLSRRLGLTAKSDPEKVEQDLVKNIPRDQWNSFGLRLIEHGRKVCKARTPECHRCMLVSACPHGLSRI